MEPLGLVVKMVEILFLGLCAFKAVGYVRWAPISSIAAALTVIGLGAMLAVPSLAVGDSAAGDDKVSAAKGKAKKMACCSHR